jgi:hypothetical protein
MHCSLIDYLITKGYIPEINLRILDNWEMELQHKRIKSLTLPFERTFSMVKDTALHLFTIDEIAENYGYKLKDFLLWNIVLDGAKPKFVDIGSFVEINKSDLFDITCEYEF